MNIEPAEKADAEPWRPPHALFGLWDILRQEMPAARILLVIFDQARNELLRLSAVPSGQDGDEPDPSFLLRIMEGRRPVFFVRRAPALNVRSDGSIGLGGEGGSAIGLPLRPRARVEGVLLFRRGVQDEPFTPDEYDLAAAFARPMLQVLRDRTSATTSSIQYSPGDRLLARTIIGNSPALQEVRSLIARITDSEAPVLISGESGTGKELAARAIHESGPRKDRNFVAVNCSAIPETLLESELFGHARGAFTGAVREKSGLIEEAAGGTFFLDEVADLSPHLQAKLLRALQEKEIRRIGENRPRRVDVRFISATNKHLVDEIRKGAFREDLFYRLNIIPLCLPPLRVRKEDLWPLIDHFLDKYCAELDRDRAHFSPIALERLFAYSWPGNVRELQNEVQRCLVLCPRESFLVGEELLSPSINPKGSDAPAVSQNYFRARAEFERRFLRQVLVLYGFNRSRTAEEIGLSRQGLFKLIKKHKIEVPRLPR